ncbi:unnamed protein product [Onchocerca flexuosa]|uniref:AP-1 complex subunit beta-1 n=1 Tax=Onchocerca flexuosa TaxID=387005 RepID=A0A183HVV3_9BILA|nr:unnamed protein product [Onchocerca flexuosa]
MPVLVYSDWGFVQLQLLTAVVKLFLKRPSETQQLVQRVLSLTTQDSDNPDLRDRGYIYWRLLSADPAAAKEVVLAEKPLISEETDLLEPSLLDQLVGHIGSLASVYHKPPSSFVDITKHPLKTTNVAAGLVLNYLHNLLFSFRVCIHFTLYKTYFENFYKNLNLMTNSLVKKVKRLHNFF